MLPADPSLRIPLVASQHGRRTHLHVPVIAIIIITVTLGGVTANHTAFGDGPSTIRVAITALLAALWCVLALSVHAIARRLALRYVGAPPGDLDASLLGVRPIPDERRTSPQAEVITGIAGLVTIVITAAIVFVAAWLANDGPTVLAVSTDIAAVAITGLAIIHAQPALPLDAGRIIRGAFWYLFDSNAAGTRTVVAYAYLVSAGLIAGGIVGFAAGGSLAFWGLALLTAGLTLQATTRADRFRARWQLRSMAVHIGDITTAGSRIRDTDQIAGAMGILVPAGANRPMLVYSRRGDVVGYVRLTDVRVPRSRWHDTTVASITQPLDGVTILSGSEPVARALEILDALPANHRRDAFLLVAHPHTGAITAITNRDVLIRNLLGRSA